jgi:hypothetical protein
MFSAEDLRYGEVQDKNATRLRYYADNKLEGMDLVDQIAHNEQGYAMAGFKELT